MKTLILVNPHAGGLESRAELEAATAPLGETRIRYTEAPGEAERLARESLEEDWDCVVAAGGDGTIHEVANGLAPDFERARLGVLPLGTGNDLARSLGIPSRLEQAVAILRKGSVRAIDVIRVRFDDGSQRYCINMATGGLSGQVHANLDEATKRTWGPLSYLRSAVEAVPDLESFRLELEPKDQEPLTLSAFSVAIANGRRVASGIPAAPEARLDDGLLDVLVIPELSLGQIALLAPQVLTGNHLGSELIRFLRTEEISVSAEPPVPFNLDGERHGKTPATFEVVPRALEVIVGPSAV